MGPEGLEIASWPEGFPTGRYTIAVFNLVDPNPPVPPTGDPINFRVDTFLRGKKLGQTATGSVRTLETSPPIFVTVP